MRLTAVFVIGVTGFAQMQDNQEKKLTCEQRVKPQRDRARFCSVGEQTVASTGRMDIDPGINGGVSVKGWSRGETLVRTRIETWAPTEGEASVIARQVQVNALGGQVRASGPSSSNGDIGWSVSYEVFVPFATDLKANALNGGIDVSDVRGRMEFKTVNGGVNLKRVTGDVDGSTQNGGVHVKLAGDRWEGNQIKLKTQNGGVHLEVPENFSGHVQAETVNGGVHSDFPMPVVAGTKRPRNLDFNIGAGGGLIQLITTNGGVHLQKN